MTIVLTSSQSQSGWFITLPATPLGDTLRIIVFLLPCLAVITLAVWVLFRFGDVVWETVCGSIAFIAEWPVKGMVLRAIGTDLDHAWRIACRYHRLYPGGMSHVRDLRQDRLHEDLGRSARSIDIAERCPNAPDYVKAVLSGELAEAASRIEDPYWRSDGHSVGLDQLEAVTWAMGAVADIEGPHDSAYHDQLITRLEQLPEIFRSDQPDPSGYGVATLMTIIRRIKEQHGSAVVVAVVLASSVVQSGCFGTPSAVLLEYALVSVALLVVCFCWVLIASVAVQFVAEVVYGVDFNPLESVLAWPFKRKVHRAAETDLDRAGQLAHRYRWLYRGGIPYIDELKKDRLNETLAEFARSIDIDDRCPNAPDYVKAILSTELAEAASRIENPIWWFDGHNYGRYQLEAATWAIGVVADLEIPPGTKYHDAVGIRLVISSKDFRTEQMDFYGYGQVALLTIINKLDEHDPPLTHTGE